MFSKKSNSAYEFNTSLANTVIPVSRKRQPPATMSRIERAKLNFERDISKETTISSNPPKNIINTNHASPINANYASPINANHASPINKNQESPINKIQESPINKIQESPINTNQESPININQTNSQDYNEDGSYNSPDGSYGYWDDEHKYYYEGYWDETKKWHEGYWDELDTFREGYNDPNGQWIIGPKISQQTKQMRRLSLPSGRKQTPPVVPSSTNKPNRKPAPVVPPKAAPVSVVPPKTAPLPNTKPHTTIPLVSIPPKESLLSPPSAFSPPIPSPRAAISPRDEKSKNERQVQNIVKEIFQTEKEYVSDLDFIVKYYLEPLEKNPIISPSEVSTLLGNIKTLKGVNHNLLDNLDKSMNGESNKALAEIFFEFSPYFKMYSIYVNNQEKQTQTFQKCKTDNKEFAEFCHKIQNLPESQHLDLGAFLIKPVQRICKYPLLFRELVKYTDPADSSYPLLEQVLAELHKTASHVNTQKAMAEKREKVYEIQELLDGFSLVTSSRQFVRQDTVRIQYPSVTKIKEHQDLILFNDALIFASSTKTKLKLKRFMLIDAMILLSDIKSIGADDDIGFEIIDTNPKEPDLFKIFFSTDDKKRDVMKDLREVLDSRKNGEGNKRPVTGSFIGAFRPSSNPATTTSPNASTLAKLNTMPISGGMGSMIVRSGMVDRSRRGTVALGDFTVSKSDLLAPVKNAEKGKKVKGKGKLLRPKKDKKKKKGGSDVVLTNSPNKHTSQPEITKANTISGAVGTDFYRELQGTLRRKKLPVGPQDTHSDC